MSKAAKFSTRIMRRRGFKDGEAMGQAIIDRYMHREVFTPETEQEMEIFGRNKLERARQDMVGEGAPHMAAQQYHAACAMGLADRLHTFREKIGCTETPLVH